MIADDILPELMELPPAAQQEVLDFIAGCCNKDELRIVDNFLRRFEIIPINAASPRHAVNLLREYRLGHGLLIADALIAATALNWNYPLASGNRRHYHFTPELELLPYVPNQG